MVVGITGYMFALAWTRDRKSDIPSLDGFDGCSRPSSPGPVTFGFVAIQSFYPRKRR